MWNMNIYAVEYYSAIQRSKIRSFCEGVDGHRVYHTEWSQKVKESCSVVSNSLWSHGLCSPWHSPGLNTGVGSLSLFQGIFPTQESNLGLPHCRRFLYQMSHKGRPRVLEQVAYPFSSRSSQPWNQTGVSWIAGGFFTNWAIREAQKETDKYCVLMHIYGI